MAEVKVAFKNVLDKRAVYKKVEGNSVSEGGEGKYIFGLISVLVVIVL